MATTFVSANRTTSLSIAADQSVVVLPGVIFHSEASTCIFAQAFNAKLVNYGSILAHLSEGANK